MLLPCWTLMWHGKRIEMPLNKVVREFKMELYGYEFIRESDLAHYGLKGMHWGTRRWQDYSGKFNEAGYQRYFGRGTGENYHRVKKGSSGKAQPTSNSANKGSSFDRDKAKKIAKGVAIGAAVVGGTVLVAYGAKKVHDLGGISKVSQDIVAKARETKIENLKLKEEFKTNMASIKSEGKVRLAEIGNNTKAELARIKEEGKRNQQMFSVDPEGKIDKNVLKDLVGDAQSAESRQRIKERLSQLDSDEIAALNSGKIRLTDLQGREGRTLDPQKNIGKSIMEASRHSPEYNNAYDSWLKAVNQGKANRDDRPIPDASHLMSNSVTKEWWNRTHASLPPAVTKTSSTTKSATQIVSEYRREHPSTSLSPTKILQNYSGGSTSSGSKPTVSSTKTSTKPSIPKLTLTPDLVNAGTNFLTQATKSYATISQINAQNSSSSSKAKQGQKAVDDYTRELLQRLS